MRKHGNLVAVDVVNGWTVRFPRAGKPPRATFVSYSSETPFGRSWFKTRKDARAFVREANANKLSGGYPVRARIIFEVDA